MLFRAESGPQKTKWVPLLGLFDAMTPWSLSLVHHRVRMEVVLTKKVNSTPGTRRTLSLSYGIIFFCVATIASES